MTTARLVMTVAMSAVVVGRTSGCTSGGDAAASCSGVVRYENRDYLPALDEDFTVGARLGTARVPECDDTPDDPEATVPEGTTGAYAVEGREPAEAIAVGVTPAEARLMEAG